jgi:hypothetical protein
VLGIINEAHGLISIFDSILKGWTLSCGSVLKLLE